MLPSLMNAMSQGSMLANHNTPGTEHLDNTDGDGLDSYPAINYGGAGGGGGGDYGDGGADDGGGSDSSLAITPMEAAAATGTSLPRTSVIEPMTGSSPMSAAAMSRGGMPMAPYGAPMAPTKGGAKERDRVVAWHPDRLMYVDDTPHTELVIGEKPAIAPTVTPPAANPANPAQTPQSGGSA
jgi:hypothetical protein